jgi:ankyrin repeat protein
LVPGRVDQRLSVALEKLQDMLNRNGSSAEVGGFSRSDAILTKHAREVLVRGQTLYEAKASTPDALDRGQEASNVCVAEWVCALELIRQEQESSKASDMTCAGPCASEDPDHFDNDLGTDIAKSALDTGTHAFAAKEWVEAESLLQEALQLLQQLPKTQRIAFDIFGLHHRLAVCAYHYQEPRDAETALASFVQLAARSDDERICIGNAQHLLSLLLVRMDHIDRARSECEKALQSRRRLLGKEHDASLESTALMAHIYGMLNNRPRAKSFMAMIPEARRGEAMKSVVDSLGTRVQPLLDSRSPRTRSTYEDSRDTSAHRPDPSSPQIRSPQEVAEGVSKYIESRLSGSTLGLALEERAYRPLSISKSPSPSIHQPFQQSPWDQTVASFFPRTIASDVRSIAEESISTAPPSYPYPNHHIDEGSLKAASISPSEPPEHTVPQTLSRKDIINKIGCHPRDPIEHAVCNADHVALSHLLDPKKDFLRSKLRKRVRPERMTALHFAALFGEVDMTRRLLKANFNINEVPYGYTARLSPLRVAIGARQVAMVEFLVERGARPSETWASLAGGVLNRSWLAKTCAEAEMEFVPGQMMRIFGVLLRSGWDVNEPCESSGATVLHQAVTFWTGSYMWDVRFRAAIVSFLCNRGANPFQADGSGKTPHDLALSSGDQQVLMILDQSFRSKDMGSAMAEPVELAG